MQGLSATSCVFSRDQWDLNVTGRAVCNLHVAGGFSSGLLLLLIGPIHRPLCYVDGPATAPRNLCFGRIPRGFWRLHGQFENLYISSKLGGYSMRHLADRSWFPFPFLRLRVRCLIAAVKTGETFSWGSWDRSKKPHNDTGILTEPSGGFQGYLMRSMPCVSITVILSKKMSVNPEKTESSNAHFLSAQWVIEWVSGILDTNLWFTIKNETSRDKQWFPSGDGSWTPDSVIKENHKIHNDSGK